MRVMGEKNERGGVTEAVVTGSLGREGNEVIMRVTEKLSAITASFFFSVDTAKATFCTEHGARSMEHGVGEQR